VEEAQGFQCRTPEAVAAVKEERLEREREAWVTKTRLR